MQHPNTNSIILLLNFTMNVHLLVHQTSQTFPSKIHISIPSSFDTMKFSISWNWSLVHTEYSTLILDRLYRKHTETQEGRYSVLVSSLLSFSGVGWVDLWLSQEVRLDDGSQSGGEVNLPPPFEETYVPPLPFFSFHPLSTLFRGNGAARAGSTIHGGHVPFHGNSRNRTSDWWQWDAIDGDDTRAVTQKLHGRAVDEIKYPLRARFSVRFYSLFDER